MPDEEKSHEYHRGDDGRLCLPGHGMPLGYLPADHFPFLIGDRDKDWSANTLTNREVCMLKLMEDITNKPEWWRKVNDPGIVAKWKKEAVEMRWTQYIRNADFTDKMADACFEELQKKAEMYEKTGLVPVLDYSACVIKSDKLIPDDLREALKSAVAPLEAVPPESKDWHPGSDGKVLDLVHPSLWPLIYGHSRVLADKRITIEDCLDHCGMGDVIPVPKKEFVFEGEQHCSDMPETCLSSRFQWLPCDVDLGGNHPRIESYINNLHPVEHAQMYPIIEKFIEKSLPAWDIVYRWPEEFHVQRLVTGSVIVECDTQDICWSEDLGHYGCYAHNRPVGEDEDPREDDEEEEDWYAGSERERLDNEWYKSNHRPDLPDPKEKLEERIKLNLDDIKTKDFFNGKSRIQVIVKLANIHLTPENPTYAGGSWHVEGQINEHICATALYYYDSDNITDCNLDFRTPANREDLTSGLSYEQSDNTGIQATFAIRAGEDTLQDIGSVLTRPDRMIFFPNLYQHHVSPFKLEDKTRPGHRKILAMFLIDPLAPVISTANVPPQQLSWWAKTALPADRVKTLPPEVTAMVVDSMEFPIGEKKAKKLREELMEERTVYHKKTNDNLKEVEWSFCEH